MGLCTIFQLQFPAQMLEMSAYISTVIFQEEKLLF